MRPSLALSIGAAFNILFGLPLLLAPAQILSAFGLATPSEALVPARDSGVLLIGVGIIDWLARDAVGAPLRGLLWGNIFIRVAGMVVNLWEVSAGIIGASGATIAAAGGINIAIIIVFALALRNAGSANP
jgi:hypothetical protein